MPLNFPPLSLLLDNGTVQLLLVVPLVLILADVVSGVASAVKHNEFDLKHLADFLGNDLVKYVGMLIMILLTWFLRGSLTAISLFGSLGMGTLSLSILSSIIENLGEIFSVPVVQEAEAALSQAGFDPASYIEHLVSEAMANQQVPVPQQQQPSPQVQPQQPDPSISPSVQIPVGTSNLSSAWQQFVPGTATQAPVVSLSLPSTSVPLLSPSSTVQEIAAQATQAVSPVSPVATGEMSSSSSSFPPVSDVTTLQTNMSLPAVSLPDEASNAQMPQGL